MNIRTATVRSPRRRTYSSVSGRKRPVKSRSTAGFSLSRLEMAGMITACVLFFMGLWTSYEVRIIATDISQLNIESVALQDTQRRLEQEHDKLLKTEYLAPIGKKLGLHPPEAGQIVTLN